MKSISTQTDSEGLIDKKIQVKLSDFSADKNIETFDEIFKEFENYQCHYCDSNINSEAHLQTHIVHCTGLHSEILLKDSNPPFKSQSIQTKSHQTSAAPFSLPFGLPTVALYNQTFPYMNHSFLLPKREHCGWTARCGKDMVNQKKTVHDDHRNPFEY